MTGLGLVPNKFVGYRIKPDWYSFNVVLVKRHGPGSKNAGKEYETTLAYCKTLPFAVAWIVSHRARVKGGELQDAQQVDDGTVASLEALRASFAEATELAVKAAHALEKRLEDAGILKKDIVRTLGPAEAEDQPEPTREASQA